MNDEQLNKYKMSAILHDTLLNALSPKDEKDNVQLGDAEESKEEVVDADKDEPETVTKLKYQKDKSNMSNIKLNHEYVFNDYSDGDWQHHRLDYCVIKDQKLEHVSASKAYVSLVEILLRDNNIDRENLIKDSRYFKSVKDAQEITESTRVSDWKILSDYDVAVYTKLAIGSLVKHIEYLLDLANLGYDTVKFSFRQ